MAFYNKREANVCYYSFVSSLAIFSRVAVSFKTSTRALFTFSIGVTFDLQHGNLFPSCLKASKYFGKR